MTELVYEQPLNEKIRSDLRLEYLDKQLQSNLSNDHQHRFFYPLFSLCELSERCDYRNEVLNDIERHLLQLTRSTSHYDNAVAHTGFYQGDSAQALALVRVKVDASHGCYPTISGHKNRFAIHFVQLEQQRHSDRPIDFLLATCA